MRILHSPGVKEVDSGASRLLQAAAERVKSLHRLPLPVQLILTDDEQMSHLNATYRGKYRTTDVLSFDFQGGIPEVPGVDNTAGEIYISLGQAEVQAEEQNVPLQEELARLLVHGLLHLAGYEHDLEGELLAMESETDKILRSIGLPLTS